MPSRTARALLAAVVLATLPAGCNGEDDPVVDASGEGTTAGTPAAGDDPGGPAPGGATPPVSVAAGKERAHLTAVRADDKEGGGSRVVFEFDAVLPGYEVVFTDRPVTMDGSGDEVAVAGEAVLAITMENAAQARFEGDKVVPTYTGPRRLKPAGAGSGAVVEVVEAGDFEGTVRWVAGLRKRGARVSVSTLSGPSRIVVDVLPG